MNEQRMHRATGWINSTKIVSMIEDQKKSSGILTEERVNQFLEPSHKLFHPRYFDL